MYDDQSVAALTAWLENPEEIIQPPPEKKYWRPVPLKNDLFYNQFMNFDQFQRICYYWQTVTSILSNLCRRYHQTKS